MPRAVAAGLRRRDGDAVSVYDLELANAAAEAGVLVTYNRQDFQELDATWRAEERAHAGIIWGLDASIRRRDVGGLVRALQVLALGHESLASVCMMLPRPRP